MNKIFKYIAAAYAAFFPLLSMANPNPDPDPVTPTLYEEICSIRLAFCYEVAWVLVTCVVIFVGVSLFVGKMKWPTLVVLATGMIFFVSAEQVIEAIFTPPPGSDVIIACSCY